MSVIKDINLAPSGCKKIAWAKANMPMLRSLAEKMKAEQALAGTRVLVCIHLEAKSAYLAQVLREAGAEVAACASNPLSTQDDVVAALSESGVHTFAIHGASEEEYFSHINAALDIKPNIIIDDGGDVVNMLHTSRSELLPHIIGGSEETTTGILRLKAMQSQGKLQFPMMAANDAKCKYLFDNRYGTGQSVWDGINRTTNLIVAGKCVVVAGYGWCGKGVAMRAKGMGARVVVTEVDPVCAIEAVMDGFEVMPMEQAAPLGDFFVTVTGCKDVITERHFLLMKEGAVLSNAGHFDVEIAMATLNKIATNKAEARHNITAYTLANGRTVNVIAEGRLVNLASGDGHPCEIMDMSFSVQTLCVRYIKDNHDKLEGKLYAVPQEIDKQVALLKLSTMGITIDTLTPEQHGYLYGGHM